MGKYIGHRLAARRELDNTFWTDSTNVGIPEGFEECVENFDEADVQQ